MDPRDTTDALPPPDPLLASIPGAVITLSTDPAEIAVAVSAVKTRELPSFGVLMESRPEPIQLNGLNSV